MKIWFFPILKWPNAPHGAYNYHFIAAIKIHQWGATNGFCKPFLSVPCNHYEIFKAAIAIIHYDYNKVIAFILMVRVIDWPEISCNYMSNIISSRRRKLYLLYLNIIKKSPIKPSCLYNNLHKVINLILQGQ